MFSSQLLLLRVLTENDPESGLNSLATPAAIPGPNGKGKKNELEKLPLDEPITPKDLSYEAIRSKIFISFITVILTIVFIRNVHGSICKAGKQNQKYGLPAARANLAPAGIAHGQNHTPICHAHGSQRCKLINGAQE
jgi:hypothetical protein